MIQTLDSMVRICCAYGLEFRDCDGFTHDWCTSLPALELAYKTSINASTNQTPDILGKGWNPKLPKDSLRKDLESMQKGGWRTHFNMPKPNGTTHMPLQISKWEI
ncbi:hypothetical protein O181_081380 [Austropuccinia psidii MF-1]|uniref:Uncharacterized protein n=1 Tax=Austropuccinia psidii MF-1 TaxID=1389203 RepID=A0A9Q3FIW8_9BASI|nr:hypothetical protein [Austropuccinia psidii MF-1]